MEDSRNQGAAPQTAGAPFYGGQFHNLDGAPAGRGLADVLRWKSLGGHVDAWPAHPAPDAVSPSLPATLSPGEIAATFVGHSTFLLQFSGGLNVLADPIWSERSSPVSFAGPRRARPPGLAFDALPPISVVLITHSHYDHLDTATLRRLQERFQPVFVTGLGQAPLLRTIGLTRIQELDWWQSWTFQQAGPDDLVLTFTPAQHWSARNPMQRNRTLWGGFWLQQGPLKVYYAGDSGLGRHFASVREQLGAPDVAFLPIGAYEPRWFMREQHMNPDEAVQAHQTLQASASVGMHFGTFQLTDEAIDAPAQALAMALQTRGIAPAEFVVPKFGETLHFPR